jgi:heme A synthase
LPLANGYGDEPVLVGYHGRVQSRLSRFAWGVLVYNLAVILWGAYVRATGSGAGCGAHWPLCNGQVIPFGAGLTTLVEFSHRVTSGLALVGVAALLVSTWRARPAGHPARLGAALSMLFILTEAGVGAGLVLFELVADNASMARALFMAVHLMNTFALVACLTLTAWWLSGGARSGCAAGRGDPGPVLGLVLVGTSGAVAALGATLFPRRRSRSAKRIMPTSHLLIRLRLLPALALVMAFCLSALRLCARPMARRTWRGSSWPGDRPGHRRVHQHLLLAPV